MSPIGNSSTQIGYLQRSCQNLSLTDGNTDYRQSIPASTISFIIKLSIRDQSALLPRQVYSKFITKTLRNHVIFPNSNGILRGAILPITKHPEQSPAKIRVT